MLTPRVQSEWMLFPPGVWLLFVSAIGVSLLLRYTHARDDSMERALGAIQERLPAPAAETAAVEEDDDESGEEKGDAK